MLKLGLTADELKVYDATRLGPFESRTRVQLWDLDHNVLEDLSSMLQSGQANDDTTAEIQTSATLELFDPIHAAGLDVGGNLGSSTPPNKMIHVIDSTFVPEFNRYVDCPLFTGVIIKPERDRDILKLECQSKEYLSLDNSWSVYVVKAGTNKATAIRNILANLTGEKFFHLAKTTARIEKDLSIGRDKSPWSVAKSLAKSLGWVLYYDTLGVLQGHAPSNAPSWTFRTGPGGNITSFPQLGYRNDALINAMRLTGGKPSAKKPPVVATAVAPGTHAYAPGNLGRNGNVRHVWVPIDMPTVKSKAEAKRRVDIAMASALLDTANLAFDAIPANRLQNGDVIRVEAEEISVDVRYRTGSRPFGMGTAAYGHQKRVSKSKARKR